jgi:acyl transferase domain-containing protein/NAD(P)-dependent dehydrogenase (short-subunit alcohol dehydrogenase family)
LFPHAPSVKDYWRLLRRSTDSVTDVPASHWSLDDYFDADPADRDLTYCRRGAFLEAFDFDPTEFGIPPTALEATDTAQLLGLVAAKSALDDAGYGEREFDRTRTSVILGVTGTLELVIPLGARLGHPQWRKALRDAGVAADVADRVVKRIADGYVSWQENSFPGLLGNVVAGRIANRLNLKGTNCVVDAACASSLSALHLATLELANRRSDMVVTGGVDTLNDIFMFMCFSKTQALSASGDARPFAAGADGTVIGEGVGMVVLKRLADAERDGDRIYAVVRGIGTSSDGQSKSIYAPRSEGQAAALRDAYRQSGVDPSTVGLVEAHGTGTRVGDAVEFDALKTVYREHAASSDRPSWCALGSVKSQIGHTKAAAGAAGLIKAALSLHHKVLPATIKVDGPNPKLGIASSPFYLNTETRPWLHGDDHPRRAAVSSFGFGGSNFHAVLEEYVGTRREVAWDGSVTLIALSADSRDQLIEHLESWRAFVSEGPRPDAVAHRAAASRRGFSVTDGHRAVIVHESERDLDQLLTHVAEYLANRTDSICDVPNAYVGGPETPGKLVFLFPGQASQYVGMGRELVCLFPEAVEALTDAGNAPGSPEGLLDCIYPPPVFDKDEQRRRQTALAATEIAQPAVGAMSLAYLRVLRRFGVSPDVVAGHSYGELVALCAAGRFDESALHELSIQRGRLMADGHGDRGTMMAVRGSRDQVEGMLAESSLEVVLANCNSPTQSVLSGSGEAMDLAQRVCAERNLATTRLPVSGAFHSPLMAEARARFRRVLDDVDMAPVLRATDSVPVFANGAVRSFPDDPAATRDVLADQLVNPVDFVTEIEDLYAAGVRTFVEVGPSKVLTNLVRDILGDRDHAVVAVDAGCGRGSGVADLARALGQLAGLGHAVDLAAWEPVCAEPRQPKMVVPLSGANYRAPKKPKPESDVSNRQTIPSKSIGPSNDNGNRDVSTKPSDPERAVLSEPTVPPVVPLPTTSAPPSEVLAVVQEGLRAMQALQQQTAAAHQRFLEGQELAHKTFQKVIESQQQLIAGGVLPVEQASPPPRAVLPPASVPTPAPVPVVEAPVVASEPVHAVDDVVVPSAEQARRLNDVPVQDEPAQDESAQPAPVASADVGAREGALLEIVGELTGYPTDMLGLDMDLEADLGIDSIKRLEILAAFQSRFPDTDTVDSSYVGSLRTLQNIIDYMRDADGVETAPAPEPAAPSVPEARPLERRVLRAVGLPAMNPRSRRELAPGREVWVVNNGTKLAQAICDRLAADGQAARVVTRTVVNDGNGLSRAGGLIYLAAPTDSHDPVWSEDAEADLKAAFALTKRIGGLIRQSAADRGAIFATVTRMDGAFGLVGNRIDPVQGGLAGLTKTVAREWSNVTCKALDVAAGWDDLEAVADAVVRELSHDGSTESGPIEVGLDAGVRRGLVAAEAAVDKSELRLSPGEIVVVTGGARGVTAEVACALAEAGKPTLVLLGRSPAPQPEPAWLAGVRGESELKRALIDHAFGADARPAPAEVESAYRRHVANREISRTIARLEALGVRVIYRAVDVRERDAVVAVFDEVRRNVGPIRALVHAAGVIEDRRIEDKTPEQFDRVFDTKVVGLRHLLTAVAEDDLKCLVLFSSVSGRFGNPGQVDYAMANEVLNKVAHRQASERSACRVVSINWGPWDGGMVTPALRQAFARQGVGLIPLEAGARSLVDELSRRSVGEVEVLIGGTLPETTPTAREPVDDDDKTVAVLSPVFDRRLDLERHAFLRSHVLGGRPVLPAALMLEWLGHAALHDNPGLNLSGLDDFRVLKGVIVNDAATDLRFVASRLQHRGDAFEVEVELRSETPDGQTVPHARATAILTATPLGPPTNGDARHGHAGRFNTYPRDIDAAYREVLFHGPVFQGIEQIEGYSDRGMVARVRSAPAPHEWMADPLRSAWLTDPLAIDVGFQLGILWSREALGAPSLPNYVASYRQFVSTFPIGGVTAVLDVRESSSQRLVADVTLLDAAGDSSIVARLEGCAWTVDASLRAAFGHQSVTSRTTLST